MRDNEKMENINGETGVLRKRSSVLDYHIEEIKKYREMGVSISSIYKIVKGRLPDRGITYNGFYRFCKRRGL